jgi:hypothetical protein
MYVNKNCSGCIVALNRHLKRATEKCMSAKSTYNGITNEETSVHVIQASIALTEFAEPISIKYVPTVSESPSVHQAGDLTFRWSSGEPDIAIIWIKNTGLFCNHYTQIHKILYPSVWIASLQSCFPLSVRIYAQNFKITQRVWCFFSIDRLV